jgi:hypothetical protein
VLQAYKRFVEEGWEATRALGPCVLGPLHPTIFPVLRALREVSGLEECSFHCSGTEAVMAAVRLCRFNTRRPLIVQFAGAYHGWWDGVQPGPGSERAAPDTLTLKDMSPASLRLIAARAHEIAAVLVSPLQAAAATPPPPRTARGRAQAHGPHRTTRPLRAPLQGLNPGAPPPSDLVLMDAVRHSIGARRRARRRGRQQPAAAGGAMFG